MQSLFRLVVQKVLLVSVMVAVIGTVAARPVIAGPPVNESGKVQEFDPSTLSGGGIGETDEKVTLTAKVSRTEVTPGSRFVIAVILDHAPHWHSHTNDPQVPPTWDFVPIPTVVKVPPVDGLALARIQWPKPDFVIADLAATGKPEPYGVFSNRAVIYVPFNVEPNATPGPRTIELTVSYQACDDKVCQNPVDDKLKFTVNIGAKVVEAVDQSDFIGFDIAGFESANVKNVTFAFFGLELKVDSAGTIGLLLLLCAAVLGGFLLNLTPCVLPVIPIKMMGLSHAAGTRSRTLLLGVMMAVGVIAFWIAIGAAIAFVKSFTAANQLFQNPWFSIGVGLFIGFMAVGMFGAFTLNLPQWVYAVDPKRNTVGGSVVFGVMTAVLSTPCTAPFGGAAMAWAATQTLWITLATFAAIGFGMALPYLILAAFPQLVKGVPKTGPASELLKQVMGLLMIAVAIFFIGVGLDPMFRAPVDEPIRFHWWLTAAMVVGGVVWMIYRLFKLKVRMLPRAVVSLAGLAVAIGMVKFTISETDRGPIQWVGFTNERFAQALKENKVVVTDFTAEWCLNCKILKKTVLHRPEVVAALNDPNVVAFRVDLTGENLEGRARMNELKWLGIPLLTIQGPDHGQPAKFDTYTPQVVLDTMAKAGFKATKSPAVR